MIFQLIKKMFFKGIHGDKKTWKLISCIHGKCAAFIVDCRKNSKNFGKWEKFILSGDNYFQILIPPNYGNSFLVLSDVAVYHYKQSEYYSLEKSMALKFKAPHGIKLNKKAKNFWWWSKLEIQKDQNGSHEIQMGIFGR